MGWTPSWLNPGTYQAIPARQVVHSLIDRLEERGVELGCASHLQGVREIAEQPTGSMRQLQIFEETNNLAEVVRRMIALTEPVTSSTNPSAR